MPTIIQNYSLGTRLRNLVGDALGAQVVEYNLEKFLEDARQRAIAPKSFFGDPVQMFFGAGSQDFLPTKGQGAIHGVHGGAVLTFHDMRGMAFNPIIGSIIQTRLNQVAAFTKPQRTPWEFGYVIVSDDPQAQKDVKRREEIARFMFGCGLEGFGEPSLEEFSRKFIRDSLTLDQATAEIVFRRNGMPAYFVGVDAATIRKTKESLKYAVPPSDTPWYVQIDHQTNKVITEYTQDEMMFGVRNPQTDVHKLGYGMSELEMLVRIVTGLLNTERYNTSLLGQSGIKKGVLVLKGDANRDEFNDFKRDFREAVRNATDYWRPPVVKVTKDSSLDWLQLDQNSRDMEFAQLFDFLVKQATAIYQISPEEVNWSIGQTGVGVNFESAQMPKITASQMKGLKPLLVFFQTLLTRSIVHKLDPRYRLEFVGLAADRKAENDITVQEVTNFKTVNEVRAERNLPALKGGDIILNSQFKEASAAGFSQFGGATTPQLEEEGEVEVEGDPVNEDDDERDTDEEVNAEDDL